jgi:hypothetical protein
VPITLATTPVNLHVTLAGSGQTISGTAPLTGQYPEGSEVLIDPISPQYGAAGVQYTFASWSDGGSLDHYIKLPSAGATYTATFNTLYELTPSVSPAGSGTVAPGAAAYYLSGSTVNITATPAAGYEFSNWTGNVASPTSSTTSITMSAPETVKANFVPLPTKVNAALTSQTGPASARVWAFQFTNAGLGQANNVEVTNFTLTQTAGTACKPVLITELPLAVGSVAPSGTLSANVSINFSSCPANAVFSLALTNSENSGASSSVTNITGLSQ